MLIASSLYATVLWRVTQRVKASPVRVRSRRLSMSTLDILTTLPVPGGQVQTVDEADAADDLSDFETGGISLLESIGLASATLMANKVRTVLTALGVIIGVGSVVALLAIGNGSQAQITDQI